MNTGAQTLRFDVVDVFAARAFAGNPLAVVHGADGLATDQLQAIAREFNLSETVFPLPPTQPSASYRARIFTPTGELPFAGHPSVGVAWVLARDGVIEAGDAVQECGAGLLPVRVDASGARIAGGTPRIGPELDAAALAEAVGLGVHDVDSGLRPGVAGAGLDFPVLPVRAHAVSRAVAPAMEALPPDARALGRTLVMAFDQETRRAHVRMFGVGFGIVEDPATGSAAVALAVFLVDRQILPAEGESVFTVYQGAEIGRPSRLEVEVVARGGAAVRTSVGGLVVPVSRGEIVVPALGTPG
jgi:trans-2,3-dihydro-3-hydroxyanthranilate isomerase